MKSLLEDLLGKGTSLAPAAPAPLKPGFKTTEFWLVIILIAAGLAQEFHGDVGWLGVVGAISAIIYKFIRFRLKAGGYQNVEQVEALTRELRENFNQVHELMTELKLAKGEVLDEGSGPQFRAQPVLPEEEK